MHLVPFQLHFTYCIYLRTSVGGILSTVVLVTTVLEVSGLWTTNPPVNRLQIHLCVIHLR